MIIDDPKSTDESLALEQRNSSEEEPEHRGFVLARWPERNDALIVARWIVGSTNVSQSEEVEYSSGLP